MFKMLLLCLVALITASAPAQGTSSLPQGCSSYVSPPQIVPRMEDGWIANGQRTMRLVYLRFTCEVSAEQVRGEITRRRIRAATGPELTELKEYMDLIGETSYRVFVAVGSTELAPLLEGGRSHTVLIRLNSANRLEQVSASGRWQPGVHFLAVLDPIA